MLTVTSSGDAKNNIGIYKVFTIYSSYNYYTLNSPFYYKVPFMMKYPILINNYGTLEDLFAIYIASWSKDLKQESKIRPKMDWDWF